jgi:hypothetical protein
MLTDQHPITPPPKLVREWNQNAIGTHFRPYGYSECIAIQAARWGADQELEACCEWLSVPCPSYGRELRAARRPKPPSLAEQALEAHERMWIGGTTDADWALIRVALERLQELESNG